MDKKQIVNQITTAKGIIAVADSTASSNIVLANIARIYGPTALAICKRRGLVRLATDPTNVYVLDRGISLAWNDINHTTAFVDWSEILTHHQ